MIARRFVMACFCLAALVTTASAARPDKDKIDKDKLIGKWTLVKTDPDDEAPPPGASITAEFTKDGKVLLTITIKDKKGTQKGTYMVKGNKLMVTMKQGDKEKKDTDTIKELTAKRLVLVGKKDGKTVTTEFKR